MNATSIITAVVVLEVLVLLLAYALCASAAAGDRRPRRASRRVHP